MKVYRHFQATNDVERLRKKHRDIWESVLQFERLLAHGQTHGHDRYAGMGLNRGDEPADIWKSRVIYPPLGGERSGLRYGYERLMIDGEDVAVALTIYVHQDNVRAIRDPGAHSGAVRFVRGDAFRASLARAVRSRR